jgi:hypothetical protein
MSKFNFVFLNKNQARRFVLFLFAAFFVWFLKNLNETYLKAVPFNLNFENSNQNYQLSSELSKEVSLLVRSSGFRLLSLTLFKPFLVLNVNDAVLSGKGTYVLNESMQLAQFKLQIGEGIEVIGFETGTPIMANFLKLAEKKIAVNLKSDIKTAPNHYLKAVSLERDSVLVRGALRDISTLNIVATETLVMSQLNKSLDTLMSLKDASESGLLNFFPSHAKVSIEVASFSELSFELNIEARGLPAHYGIKFFPSQLSVVVAAPLEVLKSISETDVVLYVEYPFENNDYLNVLRPKISIKNEGIFKAYLAESIGVEYILTKNN